MKVLIIDTNPETINTVALCFKIPWPDVKFVSTGKGAQGIELAETESPDLIILEINLPDTDGFEVLKRIRLFSDVPIVIVSARDTELDKVRGLEFGADEYISKPFSGLEFMARVRATLRRAVPQDAEGEEDLPAFAIGDLSINFLTRVVSRAEQTVHLTPKEYKILCCLIRNAGRVITHQALTHRVWGTAEYISPSTLKKYIYQLRLKLGDRDSSPELIHNERGVGYKLTKTA